MKNKFNLKQEREKLFKKYRLLDGCKNMILEQDEEFIRLLKEETTFCKIACSEGCLANQVVLGKIIQLTEEKDIVADKSVLNSNGGKNGK